MRVSGQFYLLRKDFTRTKAQKAQKVQKAQNANKQPSLRCFLYTQKAQKAQNANK